MQKNYHSSWSVGCAIKICCWDAFKTLANHLYGTLLCEAQDWVCGLPDPFLVARRLREGCATGSELLRVACSKKNNRPFIYNHTLRIPGGCPTSTKEPSRREKWWTSQLFSHTFAFLEAGLHKMDITFEHPSCCAIIFSFKFVKPSNILFKKGCAIPWLFFIRLRDPIFSSFWRCWHSISLQWQ